MDTELEREQLLEAAGENRAVQTQRRHFFGPASGKTNEWAGPVGRGGVQKGRNGNIEIKFTDRVKAISLLLEALGGGEDGMAALLDALDSCDAEESDS